VKAVSYCLFFEVRWLVKEQAGMPVSRVIDPLGKQNPCGRGNAGDDDRCDGTQK